MLRTKQALQYLRGAKTSRDLLGRIQDVQAELKTAAGNWEGDGLDEFRQFLNGVVILAGEGDVAVNGDCPKVNRVNVAIVHDGSGFNPGAAIFVEESHSYNHPDSALQAAFELLEENALQDEEYVREVQEEWGDAWMEILTEAFNGRVWGDLPAKAVAEIIEADDFASKYVDIDWYSDPDECDD